MSSRENRGTDNIIKDRGTADQVHFDSIIRVIRADERRVAQSCRARELEN